MHAYRSIHVMGIDGEQTKPFIMMTLSTGPSITRTCTATKRFGMDDLGEVRDILGWASMAFLTAADELTADGWEINHTQGCTDGKELDLDA